MNFASQSGFNSLTKNTLVSVWILLRSEEKNRLMLGWEQMLVLGYPVWGPGAKAAGVEACQKFI
jgi:hypothetical protein